MTNPSEEWDRLKHTTLYASYNEEAVLYTRMISLRPNDPDLYSSWALCLLKQKQYRKAKQKFQKSVQISSNVRKFSRNWVEGLYFERQFKEIITFMEKYPDQLWARQNAQNTLGMCFLHLGDYDSAIRCFQNVLKEEKEFEMVYFNWALALYLQEKKEEALGVFEKRKQKEIYNLYITIYGKEIKALKQDLKGNNGKELINMKIEGFEYVLGLMTKHADKRR